MPNAKKPSQRDSDHLRVREFLVEKFLLTGKDWATKEIAAGISWNVTRVRRALEDDQGLADGLVRKQEVRTSRDSIGVHTTLVYGPDRQLLREHILHLRRKFLAATGRPIADLLAGGVDNIVVTFEPPRPPEER